jgi:hypothetical protein
MTEYITINENDILTKFKKIYTEFLNNFNKDASVYVNQKYIDDLQKNYTICLNYSIDYLNETLKEDEINYQNYLYYINSSNTSSNNTIIEKGKIEFINKTKIILYCHDNNYFNYSVKLYEDFESKYKNELNNLINTIVNINLNELDEKVMYRYFESSDEFKLKEYTQKNEEFKDIEPNFLSYEDFVLYINYTQNDLYFNYLYNILLYSFKPSYTNYINNYLISPLIDNITTFINNYEDIHLDYLSNKTIDEFNYYLLLLNNTKELGVNSINALSCLYDDVKKKIYLH